MRIGRGESDILSQPKVDQQYTVHDACTTQDNVIQLDVTVHNAKVMAVRESRAYLMNAVLHMTCARNITSVCGGKEGSECTLTLGKGTLVLQLLEEVSSRCMFHAD